MKRAPFIVHVVVNAVLGQPIASFFQPLDAVRFSRASNDALKPACPRFAVERSHVINGRTV